MKLDDAELPHIGNQSDALGLLAQMTKDLRRVHPEGGGAQYLEKARRGIEALKDALEREII